MRETSFGPFLCFSEKSKLRHFERRSTKVRQQIPTSHSGNTDRSASPTCASVDSNQMLSLPTYGLLCWRDSTVHRLQGKVRYIPPRFLHLFRAPTSLLLHGSQLRECRQLRS